MKRLWGIRHVRWFLARRRYAKVLRTWDRMTIERYVLLGSQYVHLQEIWNGEA